MRAIPRYISIGANRSSSCAACSAVGLVAFGAGRLVALWDSEDRSQRGVFATLPGHEGQVTTVKLLSERDGRMTFVSGDSKGCMRVWEGDLDRKFRCVSAFTAHPGSSVSAIGVFTTQDGYTENLDGHVFTGGSDGSARLWKLEEGAAREVQKWDLGGKLPLDLGLAYLPGSDAPVLAIACTDRRIQVWTQQDGLFRYALSLEGHEDWVRCLSFVPYPAASSSTNHDLLLASGSQDNSVRLWRVSAVTAREAQPAIKGPSDEADHALDMLDEFESKVAGETSGSVQLSIRAHVLAVKDRRGSRSYSIALEALLLGHEAGLTNVHWSPHLPPRLVSSSSDNSLMLWSPSSESTWTDGVWVPEQRFGTVGGRGLGFCGALWGQDGESIIASGWNGGLERWARVDEGIWEPTKGITGHFGEVQSVVWDPREEYLLSVSSDQTTRIHGSCAPSASSIRSSVWAEIARPQIHGYDMADAAFISPFRFVSTADEKLSRAFDAPTGFVASLGSLRVSSKDVNRDAGARPKGATVPPLGLSNRALGRDVVEMDLPPTHVMNEAHHSISQTLTTIPTEEQLASSTLWPEFEKVYGHGYELVTIAASYKGDMIATACKATNAEHAVVRVVSTATWDLIGKPLAGHNLTIARISFSPDDSMILTCSRDRGWRVFQRKSEGEGYEPFAQAEKAHARMILDCCWAPDGGMFATASRDKIVKLWTASPNDGSSWTASATIKMAEGATAVDMVAHSDRLLLAVATENGTIEIHQLAKEGDGAISSKSVAKLGPDIAHFGPVNRLTWRSGQGDRCLQLASCGDDRSVRVIELVD